jgi:NCS1 family nucleobase:cation symporter-1
MARYEGFLLLIGSVFAPLFGVLLTDHFVVRRRRAEAAGAARRAVNLSGLAAWAIGVGVYQVLSRSAPDLGATLPSFVAAAAVYLALQVGRRRLAGGQGAA